MATADELGLTVSAPVETVQEDFTEERVLGPSGEELIFTEEGALTREDLEARQRAGIAPELVSEEEIAGKALRRQEAAVFDAPVTTFLERGVGTATFGLTDLLRGEESRYEARKRAEYSPTAAIAGELTGAVLPGLLSGGTGTAGTLARLTPMGRLSAVTGRIAARGGYKSAIASGVLEGAAGAAGNYVARTSLEDDPDFSGAALVSEALQGGLLGGAFGGAAHGVAGLAGRAGRAASAKEARLAKLLDEAAAEAGVAAPVTRARRTILDVAPGSKSSFKKVVKKQLGDSADAARDLGTRIEQTAARRALTEVDELPVAAALADPDTAALYERARKLATDLDAASSVADDAFKKYGEAAGLAKAKTKITADVPDVLEDKLVASVAETDALSRKLDDVTAELRARAGIPPIEAPVVSGPVAALADDLGVVADKATRLQRLQEMGVQAAGLAEVAGSTGMDIPRPSDFVPSEVGGLLGLYLKYKGLRAAAKGIGVFPASKATAAAEKVSGLNERIAQRVTAGAARVARVVDRSPLSRIVPAKVGGMVADVLTQDPNEAARRVYEELDGTSPRVQEAAAQTAARAVAYLQENAPRDPFTTRPVTMPPWKPSLQQARDFSRRVEAVADPEFAAAKILGDALSSIETEVLREVYPSVYQALRDQVTVSAETILRDQGYAVLGRLARTLDLPLTSEMASADYGMGVTAPPMPEEQPRFRQPPIASTTVNLENTAPTTRPQT